MGISIPGPMPMPVPNSPAMSVMSASMARQSAGAIVMSMPRDAVLRKRLLVRLPGRRRLALRGAGGVATRGRLAGVPSPVPVAPGSPVAADSLSVIGGVLRPRTR